MRKQSVLKTETELRSKLDELYKLSKEDSVNGFEGLLEIAKSEPTIVTAIHQVKSNRHANTSGTDNTTIRTYLEKPYMEVIAEVQNALEHYEPGLIRRKHIPKKNGKMRPLGIPNAIDKVVQQCIKIVIEPILEAKMFDHSYGFRPNRNQENAIGRITSLMFQTGYQWVVEGDIKSFFDNVDHTIMLRRLYQMGIHDKRILAIIRQMLKAGIMGEVDRNKIGTPQGGIISPLLANVYLNSFDWYVSNSWESKKTRYNYKNKGDKGTALKENSNLKPAYLIRFADDWVILTNTRENAIVWKENAKTYLKDKLKLELSDEETKITQTTRKPIKFLGIKIKQKRRPNVKTHKNSLISVSWPDEETLKSKMNEAKEEVKGIKRAKYKGTAIVKINKANAIIRGLANYYQITTRVNIEFGKYACDYLRTAHECIRSCKILHPEWMPANEVTNHSNVHKDYTTKIPAIKIGEGWLGVTSPKFVTYTPATLKNQEETPYSPEGRDLIAKRRRKKPLQARADELLSQSYAEGIASGKIGGIYNFEFYMNRAYAFSRDKGKCKCCGRILDSHEVQTHHVDPNKDIKEVNKASNLATTCGKCHSLIHSQKEIADKKIAKKIEVYRKKLN